MTTRWVNADGKSCLDCVHHDIDPAFNVLKLSICNHPKIMEKRKGMPHACMVARSPQRSGGTCLPEAKLFEKRK